MTDKAPEKHLTRAELEGQHANLKRGYDTLRQQHNEQLKHVEELAGENATLREASRHRADEVARLHGELAEARRETDKWKRAMAAIAESNPEPVRFPFERNFLPPGFDIVKARAG